jgi:hypothetical protein
MKSTKSIAIRLFLLLLFGTSASAQPNPQKIAILHWYAANQAKAGL